MGTKGDLVFGRVVDISKPFRFDAKSIFHAGYVRSDSDSSKRIILVALCADTARTLNAQLLNLGFNPVKIRRELPLHVTPTVRSSSSPGQLVTAGTSSDPALPNAQDVDTQDTILDTQDS